MSADETTRVLLVRHGALDAPELKPVRVSPPDCGVTRSAIQRGGLTRLLNANDTRHLTGLRARRRKFLTARADSYSFCAPSYFY
jgi:hypothetical protein